MFFRAGASDPLSKPRDALSSVQMGAETLQAMLVVIPAYQPEILLCGLIDRLVGDGFGAVVLVDDGSGAAFQPLFSQLQKLQRVYVLHQLQNMGKGTALKVGMRFALEHMPHIAGIVTADADGQHAADDIVRVAQALHTSNGRVVLGSRTFRGAEPLRSRVGNAFTRRVFRWMTGVSIADTQSGLRALPIGVIEDLIRLPGDRYEYEMVMLAHFCSQGEPPIELPVAAIYTKGNRSSHFRPVRDSVRVVSALLRSRIVQR